MTERPQQRQNLRFCLPCLTGRAGFFLAGCLCCPVPCRQDWAGFIRSEHEGARLVSIRGVLVMKAP